MVAQVHRAVFILTLAGLISIALWLPAGPARAQCESPTDLTTVFCGSNTMGMYCFANLRNMSMTPTVTASYRGCTATYPTQNSGVTGCTYIMGQRRLYAMRTAPVTMAYCQVLCDCGVLRLDETDGLPVELMEFGIEDGSEDTQPETDGESGSG